MKGFAMLRHKEVGWVEKERPVAGPYDAILEPIALAACTSDIHSVYGPVTTKQNDTILGHEVIGRVVEVGSEVKDFKPGDKVVVPAITPNWRALEMQAGIPHQHAGGMLQGINFSNTKEGVFAEFFHVNDADCNLALLPDGVTLQQALMAVDMMTTGFHGAELANVQFGSKVAVIGIGPVGLMAVAAATLRGAGELYAVGSRPNCVALAKEYGATKIINYKAGDIADQILELTAGVGVDHTIIAGGSGDILRPAVRMTRAGGTIGNVNYFEEPEELPLPRLGWGFGMAHKMIQGGLCPGGRIRMERMLSLIVNKRVDPGKLVSHTLSGLEGIEPALQMMKDKAADVVKVITVI